MQSHIKALISSVQCLGSRQAEMDQWWIPSPASAILSELCEQLGFNGKAEAGVGHTSGVGHMPGKLTA